jgi:NADH-quinone oxidoreductase subunit L
MAGPTPVSALIHAATMVTAGIYMIARSNILYSSEFAEITRLVISIIGLSTALVAASIALKQNDIKKVLAYSTVSQLGFMFLALGCGNYTAAVFHVMTHAFFKALLFLGSGSVIHAMGGEQDITKMGGLNKYMRITQLTFLIGCLAIAGCPPFSGFFSKDAILISAFEHSKVLWTLAVFAAMMTAYYMFRLYFLTFNGKFRGTHEQEHHLHESPVAMTLPLIILAILAIIGGFVGVPHLLGGHNEIATFLQPVIPIHENAHPLSSGTEYGLMIGTTIAMFVAALLAYLQTRNAVIKENKGLSSVLENKWYVDEIYETVIVKPIQSAAAFFNNVVEKKGIDGFVNGVGKMVNYGSRQVRLLQSGYVGTYVLLMVIGILILFIVQLFL